MDHTRLSRRLNSKVHQFVSAAGVGHHNRLYTPVQGHLPPDLLIQQAGDDGGAGMEAAHQPGGSAPLADGENGIRSNLLRRGAGGVGGSRRHGKPVSSAGHLGHALLQNFDFAKVGFHLDSAFDVSSALIGDEINGVTVRSMDELDDYVAQHHPTVAVLTVPQHVAQPLADRLVALGIRGFWNFTNVEISVPEDVYSEDIHFVDTLLTLSYHISRSNQE